MGTRAAFFIGDARDPENREWLGCIAWDGYPEGIPEVIEATTEELYRSAVAGYEERPDFAKPDGPFPYPWNDDLFLTDCVYAWYEGEIWMEYGRTWMPFKKVIDILEDEEKLEAWESSGRIRDCENIPAPGGQYDGSAPDSIIMIRTAP